MTSVLEVRFKELKEYPKSYTFYKNIEYELYLIFNQLEELVRIDVLLFFSVDFPMSQKFRK